MLIQRSLFRRLFVGLIFFISFAILFVLLESDACLDAGGIFSYTDFTCHVEGAVIDYKSLLERETWLNVVVLILLLSSVITFLLGKLFIRKK